MLLHEGPLQPVAEGRAAPIHREAAPGFGSQAPDPIKMYKPSFTLYPFLGRLARGWQVTTKPFPQRWHIWSLSSHEGGDQPFPSHPGSLVAGGNTNILFAQACRICLVFVLLSPAAFLAVVP